MNSIDQIIREMEGMPEGSPAIISGRQELSYQQFLREVNSWRKQLRDHRIGSGSLCGFIGEFSIESCSLMFALMLEKSILVPFSNENIVEQSELYEMSGLESLIHLQSDGGWHLEKRNPSQQPELIQKFRETGDPGLIVFTSGSTGKPKGILHNCELVAKKFLKRRPAWRTIMFLMPDHFGGFNTFLSSFAYGGTAICLRDRSPEVVCEAIERSKATLLPTTPTFLNFLFSSRCYRDFDLSSIKLITYGTEVMPLYTLKRLHAIFPKAEIKQTYGLSELGVLRSKSAGNDSVWLKVGGAGFDVKIKNGILYVRSESNMVGYLNAPSPFDEDGWFCTGDEVEVDGDYIRIVGRKSDIINVGGQKVFPGEVEAVLLEDPGVIDAAVYGEDHPTMGRIVVANVALSEDEDTSVLKTRLRSLCTKRLARYKIPVRIRVVEKNEIKGSRFKKIRQPVSPNK